MRFAILGTRGIPALYGGFETFAEELSVRLAARGHQVIVYCRERHPSAVFAAKWTGAFAPGDRGSRARKKENVKAYAS